MLRRDVGYVNPLFQGYGYEHIRKRGDHRWSYLSIPHGLDFQPSQSNRDAEAIARNAGVMAQLQGAGGFVPRPWLDAAGRQAFLAPFARWWGQQAGEQRLNQA